MRNIEIKVIPNAKKPGITAGPEGGIRIKVTSPPEDGRANKEAMEIICKKLKVKKKNVEIIKGHKSRNKVIGITGINKQDINGLFK